MRRDESQLTAAGLQVVLIGLGTPEDAQEFRTVLRLPFTILCDPDHASYERYGFGRMSVGQETNLHSLTTFVSEVRHYGGRFSANQDMRQLGGVFVVDRQGIIRLAFRAARASDRPATDELIRAITSER